MHDGETWKGYHVANKMHLETQDGNMETLWKFFQETEMIVGWIYTSFCFLAIEESLFKERIQEIKMIVSKRQKII